MANGAQAVDGAARQIRPPLTNDELGDDVSRHAQQGLRSEEIAKWLAAKSGSGGLKDVNARLTEAAKTVDGRFDELSKCYHVGECRNGERAADLCRHLRIIQRNVKAVHDRAKRIPWVMLNSSGGPLIFGGGALDIEFDVIRTPNVEFLANAVCN